ncbi:MAG: deoxyribodipyrimidine photo-lyase [Alphaproteobacteria bacterium]|nr:deoxyribodipyrimidine photo-lyase [Alphaproteobacteria bacterium]
MSNAPVLFWFRGDLRLKDNPALRAALQTGRAVVPVYIHDEKTPGIWKPGGASRWWLHRSLGALAKDIKAAGLHPLVFLKGAADEELKKLVKATSATEVYWNRCYAPYAIARDKALKQDLKESGVAVHSFAAALLFEPWEIQNKSGQPYRVFTPFSKALLEKSGAIRPPLQDAVKGTKPAKPLAEGRPLEALGLMPEIKWYEGMAAQWQPGEAGAKKRLNEFLDGGVGQYKAERDFPGREGVSRLSPHLHFGEVSPHTVWHAVSARIAKSKDGRFIANAQAYLRQLIWREFSWHLLYHAPDFPEQPWNKQFANFPWMEDEDLLRRWQRGQTGYPIVDAGMRQLWRTGWMHNRVRMIVGSFLVKNLLLHWRAGEDWFWDTLVDADLANNAAGWQWIAGCGADAAPYFRIFNPVLQSRKFDAEGDYIRAYVPELKDMPAKYLHAPWEAPPDVLAEARVTLGETYPHPIVDHSEARNRALRAYDESKSAA